MELSRNNANDIPPLGSPALPLGCPPTRHRLLQREASVSALCRFVFDKTGHFVLIFPIFQRPMSYSLAVYIENVLARQNDITRGLKILEIITGEDRSNVQATQ